VFAYDGANGEGLSFARTAKGLQNRADESGGLCHLPVRRRSYTGIESHENLTHYGLYDTVVARE
jgi:hypothetical protein